MIQVQFFTLTGKKFGIARTESFSSARSEYYSGDEQMKKTRRKFSTDEFCRDLARIAAKQLKRLPKDEVRMGTIILQDATSLFQPYTAEFIDKELNK